VEEGDHDSWKDFSCATKWEYFINDVDNAIGMLEQQAAAAAAAAAAGPRGRQELTYLGRSYWLRRLHSRGRDGDGKVRVSGNAQPLSTTSIFQFFVAFPPPSYGKEHLLIVTTFLRRKRTERRKKKPATFYRGSEIDNIYIFSELCGVFFSISNLRPTSTAATYIR